MVDTANVFLNKIFLISAIVVIEQNLFNFHIPTIKNRTTEIDCELRTNSLITLNV